METIKEKLNQRQITDSTKNLYLKKLEMLKEGLKEDNFEFLKDTDKVITWINQFKFAKKKSLLNSAMVGLSPASKTDIPDDVKDAYKVYRDLVIKMSGEEKDIKKEQKKNEKESEKWTTMKELEDTRDGYAKILKKRGYKQKTEEFKHPEDKDILQKLLVATLYTTQPPRRLEYGNMNRISEDAYFLESQEKRENNNYLVIKNKREKYFSFGDVKVPDPNNRVVKIPVNKVLNAVINTWLNLTGWNWNDNNTIDSFLLDTNDNPMNTHKLSKYIINKVFPKKKTGVGMIRHIYLSEKYKDDTPLKEKEELGKLMNHTMGTAELIYTKKE